MVYGRPGFQDESEESESEASVASPRGAEPTDQDVGSPDHEESEDETEESRRAALEAALRRHQMQFLQESSLLPVNGNDTDMTRNGLDGKGKKGGKEVKSVWDLGMDDLEDEEDEDESESDEDDDEVDEDAVLPTKRGSRQLPLTFSKGRLRTKRD